MTTCSMCHREVPERDITIFASSPQPSGVVLKINLCANCTKAIEQEDL